MMFYFYIWHKTCADLQLLEKRLSGSLLRHLPMRNGVQKKKDHCFVPLGLILLEWDRIFEMSRIIQNLALFPNRFMMKFHEDIKKERFAWKWRGHVKHHAHKEENSRDIPCDLESSQRKEMQLLIMWRTCQRQEFYKNYIIDLVFA